MAIVHVANFHGMKYEKKVLSTFDYIQNKNNYFDLYFNNPGVGVSYAGRNKVINDKSLIMYGLKNLVVPGNALIQIKLNKFMAQFDKAAVGDVFTFGFRYIRDSGEATVASSGAGEVAIGTITGPVYGDIRLLDGLGIGVLSNNVSHNLEYQWKKTSKTHCDFDYYLNKTRVGGSVEILISSIFTEMILFKPSTSNVDYIVSDMYFGIDKESDAVKTGLFGPLDVRHYTPSTAINTEDWIVTDGSAQSVIEPDITVLAALAKNDVGIDPAFASNITLALASNMGTFKFDNIPEGEYLGYSIDTFVNQPQSESSDALIEVHEDDSGTPLVSLTSTNINRSVGGFDQVLVTTQNKLVNQDDLRAIQVKIGSKKIIPA